MCQIRPLISQSRSKYTGDPTTNPKLSTFSNGQATTILGEYVAAGKLEVLFDTISGNERTISLAFKNKTTRTEVRSKLKALGDFRRTDVNWEILSEGFES